MIKGLFLGEDRAATKACLKLFIEKILIDLPPDRHYLQVQDFAGGPSK